MPRALEHRLRKVERQAPRPHKPSPVPPEVQLFLAGLTDEELEGLERSFKRWPANQPLSLDEARAMIVGAQVRA
jgi:hypothetical protein